MCLRQLICDNRERNDLDGDWKGFYWKESELLKEVKIHVELVYSEIILLKQS